MPVDQIAIFRGMTPIDVVKTRIQIDPSFKGAGMLSTGRQIIAKEGTKGLFTGCVPCPVEVALRSRPPSLPNAEPRAEISDSDLLLSDTSSREEPSLRVTSTGRSSLSSVRSF